MIPKRMINVNKIMELAGWEAKTELVRGISETVAWYREYFVDKTPEEVEK